MDDNRTAQIGQAFNCRKRNEGQKGERNNASAHRNQGCDRQLVLAGFDQRVPPRMKNCGEENGKEDMGCHTRLPNRFD